MSDYVGHQFGSYRLTRMLGQGGFSDVYLGEHVYLKTEAAVKVLQTRLVGSSMDDFLTEARTIARLEHPNIVRVLDFGVQDTTPFLIMAYAPNGTLRQRYPRGTIVPLAAIVAYTRQITSALQYAHNQKIIHRDIKPENILLGRNDQVLLSDFGIAIITQSTLQQDAQGVVGTVAYMSPEQIQGRARPASDQYSLAVIVYECLSGYRPFRGGFTELCAQHMFAPPPPLHEKLPGIHPAIEQVVQKALSKEPQQRFASVEAFADAFEEAAQIASYRATPSASTQLSSPLFKPYDPAAASAVGSSASSLPMAQSSSRETIMPLTPLPDEQLIPTMISTPSSSPPPLAPTIPGFIPTPSQPPVQPERRVSRRAILVGLGVAGLAAAAGGVTWFELASHSTTVTPGKTPTPTPPLYPNIGKLVSTYSGHSDWVASLSWSPDSTLVASGSNDDTVQISRASDGKQIYNSYLHKSVVSSVAWSPDGKSIASGSTDDTVQVWNPISGARLHQYPGDQFVVSVAWSLPDGARIAIGGSDNMVHVWDIALGKEAVPPYKGHSATVTSVAWSSQGPYIASGSYDGTVKIWDVTTGNTLYTYDGHKGSYVHTVAWSPDGTYIASGGNDKTVQVWNPVTGEQIAIHHGHTSFIWAVSWSPDSKRIASASADKTVQVWDALKEGQPFIYRRHLDYVHAVAWSPNGKYIASAGGNYDSPRSKSEPGPGDTSVQVWRAF
jgi:WD40 repeat protein/tRNA A-37 threonylcarbamoyl transferase component Bud32